MRVGDSDFAVWLYGSYARGETDQYSDVDLLVAADTHAGVEELSELMSSRCSVSGYTWQELTAMHDYGSLFLHHLRREGKPILMTEQGQRRMKSLFDDLPDYTRWDRDIRDFRRTVEDVRNAHHVGSSPAFELAVLGTVARHSSVLACYLLGKPSFGRIEPIKIASTTFGLPARMIRQFEELYEFRLYEDGRAELPYQPNWENVLRSSDDVSQLLDEVEGASHEASIQPH